MIGFSHVVANPINRPVLDSSTEYARRSFWAIFKADVGRHVDQWESTAFVLSVQLNSEKNDDDETMLVTMSNDFTQRILVMNGSAAWLDETKQECRWWGQRKTHCRAIR